MRSPLIALAILIARIAGAQNPAPSVHDRLVTIVPGPEYGAGPIHRKLLGEGWRDVWLTPTNVPVLDISSYAGGLKPTRLGGGNQTRTLHLGASDGRDYLFRSVNKYPVGQAMPEAIRGTTLGNIIQDQVGSLFPAGTLLVPPFLEANGILHVIPKLYVMPDDPKLGEFRKEFAGMLGTIELSPQEDEDDDPGFAGSRKIKSADEFLEDVEESRMHHLDEKELFAVRLIDLLVNDNDRTTDNMRFARFGNEGNYTWRPVPRDRDRAFADARGWLINAVVRPVYPKLVAFGPEYSLEGLVFESYNIDRRLLQRISRSDADAIALKVKSSIDDAVIEKAIAAMPREWRATREVESKLRTNLRARRDRLPEVARAFYEWLATDVDVHGTDEKERAIVDRFADGKVKVTLFGRNDPPGATPFYQRTFFPGETNEVRVFLHGGDDIAIVRGADSHDVTVRVIGGGDDDFLADSAGGGKTRFYDEKGKNKYLTRDGTRVSEKEWDQPQEGGGFRYDAPWRPDWGSSRGFGPTFGFVEGGGLVVGAGARYMSYGFRRLPHKWKAGANVLIGTSNRLPGVDAYADYRFENSPAILRLDARATRFEAFRFFGYGNDAPLIDVSRSRVPHDVIALEPKYIWQVGWRSRETVGNGFGKEEKIDRKLRPLVGNLEMGPVFFVNRAHPASQSPFAGLGERRNSRAGARFGLDLDKTSSGPPSDRGFTFKSEFTLFPPLFDIDETVTTVNGAAATYLPLAANGAHAAFRIGGAIATGDFPVQEAAVIGGRSSLRGFASRRFTGDRAAFGSAEVRLPVGQVPLFIKWKTGVFGLADLGRVWVQDCESCDTPDSDEGGWHSGFGGGLWFSSLGQTFSIAYAHGDEHRFYLQKGMSF